MKTTAATVHNPGQHVLQGVHALEVVRHGKTEDGEQQDALGGAEVAGVHARKVDGHTRQPGPVRLFT
jgi:hypothetical protein